MQVHAASAPSLTDTKSTSVCAHKYKDNKDFGYLNTLWHLMWWTIWHVGYASVIFLPARGERRLFCAKGNSPIPDYGQFVSLLRTHQEPVSASITAVSHAAVVQKTRLYHMAISTGVWPKTAKKWHMDMLGFFCVAKFTLQKKHNWSCLGKNMICHWKQCYIRNNKALPDN